MSRSIRRPMHRSSFSQLPPPATPETGPGKIPNLTANYVARNFDFLACPCDSSCRCLRLGCTGHWAYKAVGGPTYRETHNVLAGYKAYWGGTPAGEPKKSKRVEDNYREIAVRVDELNGYTALCDPPGLEKAREEARLVAYDRLGHNHMLSTKFVTLRGPDTCLLMIDATLVQENLVLGYRDLHLDWEHSWWSVNQTLKLERAILADLVALIESAPTVTLLQTGETALLDSIGAVRHAARLQTCANGVIPGTLGRFCDLVHRDGPQYLAANG